MEIENLTLYSYHFHEQWQFYKDTLDLSCRKVTDHAFQISTLHTTLGFRRSEHDQHYHFAFLMPTGSIFEAIRYLESRHIELLQLNGEKIIHFNPGKAVYFYDPDGNIVEWIEYPGLPDLSDQKFHPRKLVCVNEIGLPVSSPRETARSLKEDYGIVSENPERFNDEFCWVGDSRGVIIVVKLGRNWLPTDKDSVRNQFKIRYLSNGQRHHLIIMKDEIIPLSEHY